MLLLCWFPAASFDEGSFRLSVEGFVEEPEVVSFATLDLPGPVTLFLDPVAAAVLTSISWRYICFTTSFSNSVLGAAPGFLESAGFVARFCRCTNKREQFR